MAIHTIHWEDSRGDVVDIDYQCSQVCMFDTLAEGGIPLANSDTVAGEYHDETGGASWGAWPGGSETDYDVYCSNCELLLWKGLQS